LAQLLGFQEEFSHFMDLALGSAADGLEDHDGLIFPAPTE
jgi:hypothetical protein